MKALAIWYFEWGWILTMMGGAVAGFYAVCHRREWVMPAYILAVFFFGLIYLHFKHG